MEKNMAEKTKKITHKSAKGRTINAKPTRRTTRRAGLRPRRPVGSSKTAPAQAEKRKKKTPPRKRAPNPVPIHHPGNGSPATGARPDSTTKHGLDHLMEAIDQMMCDRSKTIADTLANLIANGNAGCAKVVVDLAEKRQRKLEMEKHQEECRIIVEDLANQPEFENPAQRDAETGKPQPGHIETIHAVEEC
jgi:hypothetical protein